MLFLVTLHYKMCGRPAQTRARPEPAAKTEARHVPLDGHCQDFLSLKTQVFSARTEPGLTRGMQRSCGEFGRLSPLFPLFPRHLEGGNEGRTIPGVDGAKNQMKTA
jgi:hypothetical protein